MHVVFGLVVEDVCDVGAWFPAVRDVVDDGCCCGASLVLADGYGFSYFVSAAEEFYLASGSFMSWVDVDLDVVSCMC